MSFFQYLILSVKNLTYMLIAVILSFPFLSSIPGAYDILNSILNKLFIVL